ncbi:hypothetical protein CDAR_8901 [Caerostris darwini]|uniref:Uncharacterized protein n=1 Tax=Caerostris darwini TaxID=1538125 RepID=A0AAV4QZK1_9ARAC|nr:hypothetical protein CDAR_8901 [Caerostris darwini]
MKVRACVCIFISRVGPLPRGEELHLHHGRKEIGGWREGIVRVNTGRQREKERHLLEGGDWWLQSPCGRVSMRRASIISCRSPSGRFDREREYAKVCRIS